MGMLYESQTVDCLSAVHVCPADESVAVGPECNWCSRDPWIPGSTNRSFPLRASIRRSSRPWTRATRCNDCRRQIYLQFHDHGQLYHCEYEQDRMPGERVSE